MTVGEDHTSPCVANVHSGARKGAGVGVGPAVGDGSGVGAVVLVGAGATAPGVTVGLSTVAAELAWQALINSDTSARPITMV